ncbi:hypothetical protein MLD38_017512 [Melastoma candidum]|uniref:Uncharacterized protein n=1 Tax=Melastoma candidum TaxID=119954 RepID=A0ACB9QUX5_9MYRT|nr:hypothetical protein MLD38_017512 [Melastoma candidum]
MDVIFEPQRGRPFAVEIGFFDTVLEIKHKIQKYQGIPASAQTLVFNGQVLRDERDVGSCELLHNSRVRLVFDLPDQYRDRKLLPPQVPIKYEQPSPPQVLPCDGSNKIQLNVRIPSMGSYFPVEVDAGDSVLMLKERIHEVEGVGVNSIALHAGKAYLDDRKLIGECDLGDNMEVDVTVRQPSPAAVTQVQAQAQGGAGTTAALSVTTAPPPSSNCSKKLRVMVLPKSGTTKIPVDIGAMENVAELRKELQRMQERMHFNLPPEGYFFIYKQNVMDEDRSFWWHRVGHGDTIEIFNGSITGGS